MNKINSANFLLGKIRERKASVGIIGLGYVCLPLVKELQMWEGLTWAMHLLSGIS